MRAVGYFSRYIEIAKLNQMTRKCGIDMLKNFFSRRGIPIEFVSDNGKYFSSYAFKNFADIYGYKHLTYMLKLF